ncbi:putative chitinase [Pseudoduganella lurida]|uniref:Putative chitinase n=1 Tax=Pseudoduganella lurida TaxID=1036180 RepID=A0A562R7W5_9BURK|nr:glycoside hydrolase family 19 protein [Pseudoduganella lurida]TWI65162.1 putative chitinase [Pseudoduganella lurida]
MTLDQLLAIMPQAGRERAAAFLVPLNKYMPQYGITTPARQAAFLSQVAHETGQLRMLREIWGPTPAQKRYEGSINLGNTQTGDGLRYRGRGLIQTTGRANYAACGRSLGIDLLTHPELLETPEYAVQSACVFWLTRGLNALADTGDQEKVTKRVNGGHNGLAERLAFFNVASRVLAC